MSSINERIEQEKERVLQDLQRQPNLFMSLAENALSVAESLRNNYFQNTAQFVARMRITMRDAVQKGRQKPVLRVYNVENTSWTDVRDEVVTFIGSGVGQGQISNQIPILLRVGSYCVRVGERRLTEREKFGYYPVIFGDLEGGSKDRSDFIDIVRITAQLLGALSVLEQTPDLRVLMFRGPLMYLMSGYAGHTPFTEKDIDLFLSRYAPNPDLANEIKENFLQEAKLEIYPQMAPSYYTEFTKKRLFEPIAWIAYLYRLLIQKASRRNPVPIIAGVVEKGRLREFSEKILLQRIFRRLNENDRLDYLNEIYNRTDLNSPKAFLRRLGYTDALLLALLLEPTQFSESWVIGKYDNLGEGKIILPGESRENIMSWKFLKSSREFGFPKIRGCYIQVSENSQPLRVEVFDALASDQITEATRRVHLYARLLPGHSFPVGLDIAEKHAKIPTWMTTAYSKLIKHHLGISLQSGEISDAEMRNILIQAIYVTNQDWLFRSGS